MIINVVIDEEQTLIPKQSMAITHQQASFYQHLLMCLNYPLHALPVAELMRCYYGLQGQWVVASPVHWQATHNDAMIIAQGRELQLTEAESRQWFSIMADFVAEEGMSAHYVDRNAWLIQCDGKPRLTAAPPQTLVRQSLLPHLQMLDESTYWQRFLTESQMILSHHGFNQKKHYDINGVWFWGAGLLNPPEPVPILCQNEFLLTLARFLSTKPCLYQPLNSLPVDSIVLFQDLNKKAQAELQWQLKRHYIRWHWNNVVYSTRPKNVLYRLWSFLKHEH